MRHTLKNQTNFAASPLHQLNTCSLPSHEIHGTGILLMPAFIQYDAWNHAIVANMLNYPPEKRSQSPAKREKGRKINHRLQNSQPDS